MCIGIAVGRKTITTEYLTVEFINTSSKIYDFKKTVLRWCTDDNGKNVLYKRNGEDRYPNFRLYRMIARTVHGHKPDAQFEFPFFNQFEISAKKMKKHGGKLIDIDELPCYV